MRKGNVKLFLDKQKLYVLVNLRINGWSISSLAIYFGCDPSSIRAQCDKYEILPQAENIITVERFVDKSIAPAKDKNNTEWAMKDGERVCLGRNYADYLKK